MDAKQLYETAGAIADALPEELREQFAELMATLADRSQPFMPEASGIQRWYRDGGWKERARLKREKCTCRCNEGKHCGGCGHAGCGYRVTGLRVVK